MRAHTDTNYAFAQFTIYPMEIIRTRLAVCSSRTYRGFWDTAGKIYRHEGPLAFYRGLAPSLVRCKNELLAARSWCLLLSDT